MTHTCRGTVYLEAAHISSNEPCHFVISNGSTVIHLRTSTETDKQRWMSALELAKQKAMKVRKQYHDSDEDVSTADDLNDHSQNLSTLSAAAHALNVNESTKISATNSERAELATMNKTFDAKLDDLKMCMDLINRHYQALHRTLGDLEQMDKSETTANTLKSVNERATLFRITSTGNIPSPKAFACDDRTQPSAIPELFFRLAPIIRGNTLKRDFNLHQCYREAASRDLQRLLRDTLLFIDLQHDFFGFVAMVNACQELVQLIQNQGRKWQKALQFERDARMRMERMCEQVASQSAKLEKQMQRASRIEHKSLAGVRSTLSARRSSDLRATNESGNLSDDDEFYDAIDDPQTIGVFRIPYVVLRLSYP